jgi:hypothetical protein
VVDVLIVILNWQQPLWEGDQKVVKRSGRIVPILVVIHMYMETTQGIYIAILISN